MKRNFIAAITLFFTILIFGQNRIEIGIGGGPDYNFYKYSNFKYKDYQRTNKLSLGFSAGLIFNYSLNDKIDLYSNIVYSKKNYAPDRLFDYGVLRTVKMNTLDIPLNFKYKIKELDGWIKYLYLLGGLTYQIELYKKGSFDWFSGYGEKYNFIKKANYIFPNLGIGGEKELNENTILRVQLNSRFLKCHCEYLNPIVDKIGIEVLLMKAL